MNARDNLSEDTVVQRPEMLPVAGTMESHVMANVARRVREVCQFVIQNRGRCFPVDQWPERKLFRYLTWHFLNGNVFLVRACGEICGMAIAWPDIAREVEVREAMGEPHFTWKPQIRAGDCVMIAEVIGTRQSAFGWRKLALERWPDLHARRFFTFRRGKLKEISYGSIKNFCQGRKIRVTFEEN